MFALTIGFLAMGASAMLILKQANAIARSDNVITVKMICEEDSRCYQARPEPVAPMEKATSRGPYVGPGYYGSRPIVQAGMLFWWRHLPTASGFGKPRRKPANSRSRQKLIHA